MPEQTTCDCILTSINDPFNPGNFAFDFKQPIVDEEGAFLDMDFTDLIQSDFELDVENKSDTKSLSIVLTGTGNKIVRYNFNTPSDGSTYWETPFRTDTFELKIKNTFTGETSIVKVTIRSLPVFANFDPANITVNVKYPYPETLRVNLDYAWGNPEEPPEFMVYKTGNYDSRYIDTAFPSTFGNRELMINIEDMAKASTPFTTEVPFYVANVNDGPVSEQQMPIGFANVILNFMS